MTGFIKKPWGEEEILVDNDFYKIKRIRVYAGQSTSKQYHINKIETWIYQDGSIYHIPPYEIHRLVAPNDKDIEVIEVSHGVDSDIVRLEDRYGRITKKDMGM